MPTHAGEKITRRRMMHRCGMAALAAPLLYRSTFARKRADSRPNFLFCIADDWGWPYAPSYGDRWLNVPGFERLAREGALFNNAFSCTSSCSPSRSNILSGQITWRLGEAINLWKSMPSDTVTYPHILKEHGYHLGRTGKPWSPGDPGVEEPIGPEYTNFGDFMNHIPEDTPFCFWLGSYDPHRPFGGDCDPSRSNDDVHVPGFLPDVPEVRQDIKEYCCEIESFDRVCNWAIEKLEAEGMLDNTIVIMTGDQGMPFPRAKAHCYDYSNHVPFAVRWGAGQGTAGRVVDDLVDFDDIAATFLEAAGVPIPEYMTGTSFLNVLKSDQEGIVDPSRDAVYACAEDHVGYYPERAIRTHEWHYIRNFEPDLNPNGGANHGRCDNGPTKTFMLEHKDDPDVKDLYELSFGKRPAEELYYMPDDPFQMNNLAEREEFRQLKEQLWNRLRGYMCQTGDPRSADCESVGLKGKPLPGIPSSGIGSVGAPSRTFTLQGRKADMSRAGNAPGVVVHESRSRAEKRVGIGTLSK